LEWEITDDVINQYIRQLDHLEEIFKNDDRITTLIELQHLPGKIIKTYRGDIHPFAVKMIRSLFRSMNTIASNSGLRDDQKRIIVNRQIENYRKLKQLMRANKNSRRERIRRLLKNPGRKIQT